MNRVVLIVDDEAEIRKLLTVQLKREGFNVYTAESGEKAIELLESGVHVDAIVSDIRMPGGMDGVELIKSLKEKNIILPVNILMSGHAILQPEEIDSLDLDHCFSKPFSVRKLASILHEKLGLASEEKSPRKHPRMRSELEVKEDNFTASTSDVSLGGVFIKMDQPLPVGTRFSVQIDLEPPILVELEVKWTRPQASKYKAKGIGCEFVDLSAEDAEKLKSHLNGTGEQGSSMLDLESSIPPKKKTH